MDTVFIFDVDGVMVRGEPFGSLFQRENKISAEDILPFYSGIFQDCLIGKVDLKEVIIPWLQKWKYRGTADGFLSEWFRYEHRIDTQLIRYIEELRINQIPCYLATNQEKYRTEYIMKDMGFGDIFDGVFSSAYIGYKKPKREFYQCIIDTLGADKKIILIDDMKENIEGAQLSGIDGYLYTEFDIFYKEVEQFKIRGKL